MYPITKESMGLLQALPKGGQRAQQTSYFQEARGGKLPKKEYRIHHMLSKVLSIIINHQFFYLVTAVALKLKAV